ncbi:hypothetical protein R1flu_019971 [Riccia fluitans]|uniref:Uncharacterized protein n=1 Tax=Riccia fluitans TaxID=41844 RepID=A0ABD1ZKE5_9MARC
MSVNPLEHNFVWGVDNGRTRCRAHLSFIVSVVLHSSLSRSSSLSNKEGEFMKKVAAELAILGGLRTTTPGPRNSRDTRSVLLLVRLLNFLLGRQKVGGTVQPDYRAIGTLEPDYSVLKDRALVSPKAKGVHSSLCILRIWQALQYYPIYPDRFHAAAVHAGFAQSSSPAKKSCSVQFTDDKALLLYSLFQQGNMEAAASREVTAKKRVASLISSWAKDIGIHLFLEHLLKLLDKEYLRSWAGLNHIPFP